jgi:hypothetical protein
MKICLSCNIEKEKRHYSKNDTICNTCYRKQVKLIKTCNKCKNKISVKKFNSGKICDDCISKIELEKNSTSKFCSKCKRESPKNRFNKNTCYDCLNISRKKRILDGISKKYPTSKLKMSEWRLKNKEKIKKYRREYSNTKYKNDINYKLLVTCRSFIRRCLMKKNDRTFNILGYTPERLKQRLECQFKEGMSWDNYGTYWNIDHRKPISMFNLLNVPVSTINMLCNLKPVIKEYNFAKSNKFIS